MIKEASNDGWLKSVSYFVRMKSLYRNNTFYNYSLRRLGEVVKCSPACLAAHLKILEAKGLISFHNGNITFAGLGKLQSMYGIKNIGVPVDINNNFKNQYDILRGQIIRFNLASQQHRINKSELQHCRDKYVPNTKNEKMNSSYVGLSANGIGNLFSLSMATGSRIRGKLKNLNQISVKRRFSKLLWVNSYNDFINLKRIGVIPIYSLFNNGLVVKEVRPEMQYNYCPA
ncbi:MAG: hypothetical protein V4538_15020 [Bacteroidota bacterium]